MKTLLYRTALSSCLVLLSLQVFAKAPVYQCAIDSEVIDVTLNQRGVTKDRERVSIGHFQINKIGDLELAHKMNVRLSLVEKRDSSRLFLTVNSKDLQVKKQTSDRDLTDLIQVRVPMKNQSQPLVSIQCQSLEKLQLDYEITEGKIEASMMND